LFGGKVAKSTPVLYGGSVNAENAEGYMSDGIDGLLIGGASLNANEFASIIKSAHTVGKK
jgi:triosephosphate isomerase